VAAVRRALLTLPFVLALIHCAPAARAPHAVASSASVGTRHRPPPSPPPAAAPVPPQPPPAPPEPPPVEEEPASELPGVYDSVAALCTEFLNRAEARKGELTEQAASHEVPVHAPSCSPHQLPVTFTGDATYRGVSALLVSDGLATHHLLVARLAAGYVATSVTWAWDDPTDPGCPSNVYPTTIESVFVQGGHLVTVIGSATTMYVESKAGAAATEDGARGGLVRTVAWCKGGGRELRCRTHGPPTEQGLGWKMQPNRDWNKRVPWGALPWKDVQAFSIDEDGALRVHP